MIATGAATVFAIATVAHPAAAVAPVLIATALYTIWKIPLRWSTSALIFLLLSVDLSDDAEGVWHTPFVAVGNFLRDNLDKTFGEKVPVKLNGMEVVLLCLAAVAIYRRAARASIDTRGQVQTAGVVRDAALVYLGCLAFAAVNGLASGGSTKFAIVQVRPLLHVPALFLVFQTAFRVPADLPLLGRLVILTALIKSGLAVWVYRTVAPQYIAMGDTWQFSTNHGDSILFSVACVILVAPLMENADRKSIRRCLIFLPPILLGMHANCRRLAWVDLTMALLAVYALVPWNRSKRALTRGLVLAAPVLLLYASAGWNSGSTLFAPVRMLRSITDAKVDRSTLYRDLENWNLVMSIDQSPILGRGFGHEFTEFVKGDDLSTVFELYRVQPHNAVLGLLMYAGLLAFTGMWMLVAIGVFFAARSHRFARAREHRTAALTSLAVFIIACVQTFGDMGQYYIQWQIFTALALAVSGKLAVLTGAWPRGSSSARAAAA